jgi:hypothetical protein
LRLIPRNWGRRVFLWLSLTVVLTCALGSFGSAVQASSGSAFNAFTSDVSLGPERASVPEKARKEQAPPAGAAGQAKALRILVSLLAPPRPALVGLRFEAPPAPPVPVMAGAVGARAPPRP